MQRKEYKELPKVAAQVFTVYLAAFAINRGIRVLGERECMKNFLDSPNPL